MATGKRFPGPPRTPGADAVMARSRFFLGPEPSGRPRDNVIRGDAQRPLASVPAAAGARACGRVRPAACPDRTVCCELFDSLPESPPAGGPNGTAQHLVQVRLFIRTSAPPTAARREFHDFALFESWCDHNPCLSVYAAEISPLCLRRPAGLLTLPPKHGWKLERPPVPDPGGRLFLPAPRHISADPARACARQVAPPARPSRIRALPGDHGPARAAIGRRGPI